MGLNVYGMISLGTYSGLNVHVMGKLIWYA